MATKFSIPLLFLFLLAFQGKMIMRGDAETCKTKSNVFKGICISDRNCGNICEKEGFESGQCGSFLKCVCSKDCGIGGGVSGQGPPGKGPPEQGPPATGDQPPADGGDMPPVLNRKSMLKS